MADLLPTFLVIGAMKAGTTTLCRDLDLSPSVFFPTVKEPHTLCLPEVVTPEGRRRYAALFRNARPEMQRGEGSTGYTKRPGIDGVVERARSVLGPDLKLIYIVRHPLARIVSHHQHLIRGGDAPADINEAVRVLPELLDVSRYAMQLEPWVEAFGLDQLRVVVFEDYIGDRQRVVTELCAFLGADVPVDEEAFENVHNAASEALVPPAGLRSLSRRITRSQFYKRVVHPRTPRWVRERFKSAVYTRPDQPVVPLTEATRDQLAAVLRDDLDQLHTLFGANAPTWDLSFGMMPRPSTVPSTDDAV